MLAILTLISCGERKTKENACAKFQPKTYPLEAENQNFAREVSDYTQDSWANSINHRSKMSSMMLII